MRKPLAAVVILALLLAALVPVAYVLVPAPIEVASAPIVAANAPAEDANAPTAPALIALTASRHLPRAGLPPVRS